MQQKNKGGLKFPEPRETKRNKLIPAGRGLVNFAKKVAQERSVEYYQTVDANSVTNRK